MDTLRDIIRDDRGLAIEKMNRLLASSLFFHNLYRRYHWMVTGPHFQPLHELFDQHMATLEGEIDDFGERIRILGGTPVWNPAVYAETKLLPNPDESLTDDLAVAREAFEMEVRYADALRETARELEEDMATQDLVIEYLRHHEKQAWFLREFVRKVHLDDYEDAVMASGR